MLRVKLSPTDVWILHLPLVEAYVLPCHFKAVVVRLDDVLFFEDEDVVKRQSFIRAHFLAFSVISLWRTVADWQVDITEGVLLEELDGALSLLPEVLYNFGDAVECFNLEIVHLNHLASL